jgi:hypothetical protein
MPTNTADQSQEMANGCQACDYAQTSKEIAEVTRGRVPPALARAESDISRSLDEVPEELPCRNPEIVPIDVIPADIHQLDEAALSTACNRKCACKPAAAELPVVLLVGAFLPGCPVRLENPCLWCLFCLH